MKVKVSSCISKKNWNLIFGEARSTGPVVNNKSCQEYGETSASQGGEMSEA